MKKKHDETKGKQIVMKRDEKKKSSINNCRNDHAKAKERQR